MKTSDQKFLTSPQPTKSIPYFETEQTNSDSTSSLAQLIDPLPNGLTPLKSSILKFVRIEGYTFAHIQNTNQYCAVLFDPVI